MEAEGHDRVQPVDGDKCVKLESDETFDNPCQPCLSEDKHVESRKFCVECQEYLCEACIQFHQKVTVTKKHHLTNKDQVDTDSEVHKKKEPKPLPVCSLHGGKPVNWFCNSHDKLVCQSCAIIYHVSCKDILSIEEAAHNARQSDEFESIAAELKDTRCKFEDHIAKRETDKKRFTDEGKNAMNSLEWNKTHLIGIITKLKLFDEKKIKEKLKSFSAFVTNDIQQCEEMVSVLGSSEETMDNIGDDAIHAFIQMKIAKENLEYGKKILSTKTEDDYSQRIVYTTNHEVSQALEPFKRLGNLEFEKRVYNKSSSRNNNRVSLKASLLSYSSNELCIRHSYHKGNECNGNCICIVDDGYALVTDSINLCVNIVHISRNTVRSFLKFEHSPFDVCKLPNNQAAVTLVHEHTVKLVSYDLSTYYRGLGIDEVGGFHTVEKCRGIAYYEDLLYVACGGGSNGDEAPGHIRVYSVEGDFKKTIVTSSAEEVLIRKPWKLAVSLTNELYVTDQINGLLKIKDDHVEQTECKTRCDNMTFDEHGHIFVSSGNTNIIQQLKADGTKVTDLLTEEDGVKSPQALWFDCKKNILYVAMKESADIKMYSLDFE